jgi:histidinol-phosphate aminotransferase
MLQSPNDPTGGVIPEDALRRILDEGKITVVDESYYEFYGKTVLPLLPEYNNLIVVQSLSHAFALAGLRVAYAVADAGVSELLNRVKPPLDLSSIALEAALGALHDDEYMIAKVKEIRRDREMLYRELSARFKPVKSCANFVLVDVSPMSSKQFCERARYFEFNVRDVGRLDGFSGEYVRISVGTWEETNAFVHILGKI